MLELEFELSELEIPSTLSVMNLVLSRMGLYLSLVQLYLLFINYSSFYKDLMNIEVIDNKLFSEIWVDEKLYKEIHRQLYRNYLREILRCSTIKDLSDLFLRVDMKIGRGIVYKLLALRGYMKSELTKKLKRYKIAPEAIEEILSECEKLGYLDDQREGKLFIAREKRRGIGPQIIAYKLQQKAPELKEMVREGISDEEQLEAIKKWIEKKTRRDNFSDIKVKERLYRFLSGKGFDDHLIRQELFTT